jgi:hypothetical protein
MHLAEPWPSCRALAVLPPPFLSCLAIAVLSCRLAVPWLSCRRRRRLVVVSSFRCRLVVSLLSCRADAVLLSSMSPSFAMSPLLRCGYRRSLAARPSWTRTASEFLTSVVLSCNVEQQINQFFLEDTRKPGRESGIGEAGIERNR